jgi:predicted RNase H-like HicB family nuclease
MARLGRRYGKPWKGERTGDENGEHILCNANEGYNRMKIMFKIMELCDGTYHAWCPALPGCVVYGVSRSEAGSRIQQAIDGYMEHLDVALPRELARSHTRP